ncbi:CpaF family protein [Solwaraspora sp. WMMB335]|uniref:CpaF family protein n=1 Tax=Solwaraspora sp. WMMB335 TaxID=3404118 RepID=UPI003B95D347
MRFEPVLSDPRNDPDDQAQPTGQVQPIDRTQPAGQGHSSGGERPDPQSAQHPGHPWHGQPQQGQPHQGQPQHGVPRHAQRRPWPGNQDPVTSITPPLGPNGIPGEPAPHSHTARHNWPLAAAVGTAPAGTTPGSRHDGTGAGPAAGIVPPVPGVPVPPAPGTAAPALPNGLQPPLPNGHQPPLPNGLQPPLPNGLQPPLPNGYQSAVTSGPPTASLPAVPAASAPATQRPRTDFALVRELRRELSTRLTRWQRGREFTIDEEDVERARIAVAVVAEYADQVRRAGTPLTAYEERVLLDQVTAELVGLGRLQTLLVDDSIEEVHILGCDQVRITRRSGQIDWHDPIADSDDELVEILQAAARRAGSTERSLSTSKPTLDLQLPDGSRLAAVYLVSHRPYAVIRKHNTLDISLDDVAGGRPDLDEMIDVLGRDFLRAAMRAGLNIMVAGLAGAGKTTIIRALMNEIPPDEPYVLLEESRELLPARRTDRHRAVMSFEAREGHGERGLDGRPAGEVSIADLIPISLRMGVLRIIVGEVRSREIVPMLQAMTTSRGSMCTIHARTPSGVGERIVELALSHGREMTVDQARRMAGNALDLIVYVTVEDETGIGGRKHRFVSHIEEVVGVGEGGRIATTTVFGPGADGRAIPRHLPERIREQLLRVGYDARGLSRFIEAGVGGWRRPRHSLLRVRQ